MQLVTRSAWLARPPRNRQPLNPDLLKGVAVHYTGMDADEQVHHGACPARVRGIQNFHMDTRGWSDIAYNFIVCKHGAVFEGRGYGIRSAGQGTNAGNDGYHAVCFLGDDTAGRDDVTDTGREALGEIIRALHTRYPHARDVQPHSHFHQTACPGDDLRTWVAVKGWLPPAPKLKCRPEDWKWARWYLGLGEYAPYGRRAKGKRPPYPRIIPARGWAAVRWYLGHR